MLARQRFAMSVVLVERVADGFNGAYRYEHRDRRCTTNDYNNCKRNLYKTYVVVLL